MSWRWGLNSPTNTAALHLSHGASIFICRDRWPAKLPLTMGKVTFIPKFATFSCIELVAQPGLSNWWRRTVWEGLWNIWISTNWWNSRTATNIDHLIDSFKAPRNIMQEMASLAKWTSRGAA
ncbi:hypothetical protein MtrunA17_Chr1g0213731 [Medicago truncatula]|uniref:Uncharacterized protein n=1 Tax=Medicago truncatula TaxID=3880 RepID=A0A396KCL0_MEDTR|nr:hypothetical protein MtrunA17_Chr1g0213731 [Medicago truncatula]